MNKKRLKNIWYCMIRRCHKPAPSDIGTISPYYYDKGIIVCDEWRKDFRVFERWALQNGYADTLTIDRVNPDGNYEPSNCRWITMDENRSRVKHNGGQHRKPKKQAEQPTRANQFTAEQKADAQYFIERMERLPEHAREKMAYMILGVSLAQ